VRRGAIVGRSRELGEAQVEIRLRDATGAVRTGNVTIYTQDPDIAGTVRAIDTEGTRLWGGVYTSVSDDGQVVAFTSGAPGLIGRPGVNDNPDVFTWDRTANLFRRLTTELGANHTQVEVSGDGGTVVFQSDATGLVPADPDPDLDVFLVDAAGGPFTLVTTDDDQGQIYGASVSDDGSKVAYSATTPGPVTRLFLWDRATGQSTLVAEEDASSFPFVDLSDDGSRVLFASSTDEYELFVADTATGARTRMDIGFERLWGASLSGDGTTVAITSDTTAHLPPGQADTNGEGDVFRADAATGAVERITNGNAPSNGAPSISDDGTIIAFNSLATDIAARERDQDQVDDVFIWNAETDLVSRVTRSMASHGDPVADLEVSGNGRTIAFSAPVQDLDPNATPVTGDWMMLYVWDRAR
jgi:Tol biopolymer transport system component